MAKCLKNRWDDIILDLSRLDLIETVHLGVIIRWLRNVKSLGGKLFLVGVQPQTQTILSASGIQDICEVFPSLQEFEAAYPAYKVKMESDYSFLPEKLSSPKVQSDRLISDFTKPERESTPLVPPNNTTVPPREHSEDSEKEPALVVQSETPVKDSPSLLSQRNKNAGPEGPITDYIDIRKLAEMNKETDVSKQLDFLQSPDIVDIPEPVSQESSVETKQNTEEQNKTEYQDNEESTLRESSLTRLEDMLLEEDEFADEIDDDLNGENFALDGPESESPLKADSEDDPFDEALVCNPGVPVELSGEYQCLGCGQSDVFLRSTRFHQCTNKECQGVEDGWYPIYILF
ncbi:MAG: STAS domain-containing protein [Fibrobacteria bacterium]|nr:STAS domain-containing protein [Fibrobacteria bacterium]